MLSTSQQIKERISILDVVSSYVKLEKAGSSFKGRCPFHTEKTASFFVSPSRGNYHCFGCGRGGDIFSFLEEIEGIPFAEALVVLGERAGVQIPHYSDSHKTDNGILFSVLTDAATFYEENLEKNNSITEYLLDRGLTKETIKEWRIGYAPSAWSTVTNYLMQKGYASDQISRAGLSVKGEKNTYDRFRDRIMFPLANQSDKIVGFSGRIVPQNTVTKSEPEVPKYVNSPETELFHKSTYLFGYGRARKEMVRTNIAVVVEGQFDLILAHQIGTTNTVAVSGTAFTESHVHLLERCADTIVFVLDSDAAGVKASERAAALVEGMNVKIARLPDGLDPAEAIRKDPQIWHDALKDSLHLIDFLALEIKARKLDSHTEIKTLHTQLYPYLIKIPTYSEQEYFIKRLSNLFNISEESIRQDLLLFIDKSSKGTNNIRTNELHTKTYKSETLDLLLGSILWQKNLPNSSLDLSLVYKKIQDISGVSYEKLIETRAPAEKDLSDLAYRAEIEFSKMNDLEQALTEVLLSYEILTLQERFSVLLVKLKNAEQHDNSIEALEILGECQLITKKIHEIKSNRLSK